MELTKSMQELGLQKKSIVKREGYLEWEDYFMALAFLAAKRSKDPHTQVGACIVTPDKKIVGLGYNGMPIGCDDDIFPWGKDRESLNDNKHLYVCHAELNAILNKNIISVKGCTLYVALFPCNECAKLIIQSEIKEIVYVSDKNENTIPNMASKRMLNAANVTYRQFTPKNNKIVIDFEDIRK